MTTIAGLLAVAIALELVVIYGFVALQSAWAGDEPGEVIVVARPKPAVRREIRSSAHTWEAVAVRSTSSDGQAGYRRRATLDCLTERALEQLRTDAALFEKLFDRCEGELAAQLPAATDLRLVFATVAAHRFAPYGRSTAHELDDLLAEPVLDCDNYMALAYHLRSLNGRPAKQFRFIGYDGPTLGNHAMMSAGGMWADATLGLVVLASFEHVMRGEPVAGAEIYDFSRPDGLEALREREVAAFRDGLLGPSEVLYSFDRYERFIAFAARIRA